MFPRILGNLRLHRGALGTSNELDGLEPTATVMDVYTRLSRQRQFCISERPLSAHR